MWEHLTWAQPFHTDPIISTSFGRKRGICPITWHHLSFSLFSLIFSHSLSVLTYPELSPILRLFRSASSASAGLGFRNVEGSRGGGGCIERLKGSVSVSLSPSGTFSTSGDFSLCLWSSGSSTTLADSSSATNQLMDHHNPPQRNDNTMKWTLYVARRRQSKTSCKQAKEALVATSSVEVGPGTKTLFQSSSKNEAIPRYQASVRGSRSSNFSQAWKTTSEGVEETCVNVSRRERGTRRDVARSGEKRSRGESAIRMMLNLAEAAVDIWQLDEVKCFSIDRRLDREELE